MPPNTRHSSGAYARAPTWRQARMYEIAKVTAVTTLALIALLLIAALAVLGGAALLIGVNLLGLIGGFIAHVLHDRRRRREP